MSEYNDKTCPVCGREVMGLYATAEAARDDYFRCHVCGACGNGENFEHGYISGFRKQSSCEGCQYSSDNFPYDDCPIPFGEDIKRENCLQLKCERFPCACGVLVTDICPTTPQPPMESIVHLLIGILRELRNR